MGDLTAMTLLMQIDNRIQRIARNMSIDILIAPKTKEEILKFLFKQITKINLIIECGIKFDNNVIASKKFNHNPRIKRKGS